ncbi:nucleoside diphosphate kinase regulator [Lentibacter sp. XHP0401]|uniref:nucleoside diphosphate kinase regulator n=1 Tax=Lentibacter sp. XHP0401 TaxID=2984334 RepID=UPI0021E954D5|nr:nucleoside diphosphate kinase regulator [Lentibacter sp. XHP0401]MCV2892726.1 nucleoside diphosphate kinase regulator [Lentibacter sp. XHP0401]
MSAPSKPRRTRRPKIVLSSNRLAELEALAEGLMRRNTDLAELLVEELGRARIVSQSRLRPDVVDIGREVTYRDELTGQDHTITLVIPQDADISKGWISVITPIGIALIGLAEDAVFHWETRDGHRRELKVLKVATFEREALQDA